MSWNTKLLNYNGEGKISGGSEITIDTLNSWQMLTNITEGRTFNGIEFEAGDEGSITAFADAGRLGERDGSPIEIFGTVEYPTPPDVTVIDITPFLSVTIPQVAAAPEPPPPSVITIVGVVVYPDPALISSIS